MPLTQVGYYQIEGLLGEGGMGSVYSATHRMTGRKVAVKTLRAELAARADLNGRFFNEARTMSFLDHPSIARVHDVGRTPDGTAYMVMELCKGPTLGELMRSEPRIRVKLGMLSAVAAALAYAHRAGVVHRDLKPDNVIVTASPEGPLPRVLDFGIAKVMDGAVAANSPFAVKTQTGAAMGTPLYMSPEQCRGVGNITGATDVYALGIMAYEAVTGRVPFHGGVGEVIVQHITTPVPSLSGTTIQDAHPGLPPLIDAMLQKDPNARPKMAEVLDGLSQYAQFRGEFLLADSPPSAPGLAEAPPVEAPSFEQDGPEELAEPSPVRRPRRSASIAIPLLVGLLVAAGAVGLALQRRRARPIVVAPPSVVAVPVHKPAPAHPTVTSTPLRWRIESAPSGADVFSGSGLILGTTPYVADSELAHGERQLYVRKSGFADEIVKYDPSGRTVVRLRARAAPRPAVRDPGASRDRSHLKAEPVEDDDFTPKPLQ